MSAKALPNPTRVATYARVSTTRQAVEGTSLVDQGERLPAFAQQQGWQVVGEYEDKVSGSKFTRPALDRLLAACRAGEVDRVIVTKVDRLGRDTVEGILTANELEDTLGIEVYYLDEGGVMPREMRNMRLVWAEAERDRIIERTMSGRLRRIREGKWTAGVPPFGFEVVDQRLVVNEEEAGLIREAARVLIEERKTPAVVAYLNAHGRTRKDAAWRRTSVRNLLRSRRLLGEHSYGKDRRSQALKRRQVVTFENIDFHTDPILDLETWDKVQKVLDATTKVNSLTKEAYPLSRVIVSPCGAHYNGAVQRGIRYYRCKHIAKGCGCPTLRADHVEALVRAKIGLDLLRAENLDAMLEERRAGRAKVARFPGDLTRQIGALDRRITDLMTNLDLDMGAVERATKDLAEQRDALVAQQERADAQRDAEREDKRWEASLHQVAEEAMSDLETPEGLQRIVETFGLEIERTAKGFRISGVIVIDREARTRGR